MTKRGATAEVTCRSFRYDVSPNVVSKISVTKHCGSHPRNRTMQCTGNRSTEYRLFLHCIKSESCNCDKLTTMPSTTILQGTSKPSCVPKRFEEVVYNSADMVIQLRLYRCKQFCCIHILREFHLSRNSSLKLRAAYSCTSVM